MTQIKYALRQLVLRPGLPAADSDDAVHSIVNRDPAATRPE